MNEQEQEQGKKKGILIVIIAAAVIFVLSGVISVYMLMRPKGTEVEIISDGEVLYTLDLQREKDREIIVEYKGRKNVIAIEDHDIYMKEAECPDHICIKTGRLSKSGVPIVCLPNKLMIKYKASAQSAGNAGNAGNGDIDAAA